MTEDMLDVLRALPRAGARWVVIGGYALALLGRPVDLRDLEEL